MRSAFLIYSCTGEGPGDRDRDRRTKDPGGLLHHRARPHPDPRDLPGQGDQVSTHPDPQRSTWASRPGLWIWNILFMAPKIEIDSNF